MSIHDYCEIVVTGSIAVMALTLVTFAIGFFLDIKS